MARSKPNTSHRGSTQRVPSSPSSRKRSMKSSDAIIPEPLHIVEPTHRSNDARSTKMPTLVLRGEWLKAAGFPIGSDAYVIIDARGELALHRSGLRSPRTLRVIARR